MTCSTASCTPLRKSIGFIPAATALHPSEYIARARMVAVVVPACKQGIEVRRREVAAALPCATTALPSPAWSLVLLATPLTS